METWKGRETALQHGGQKRKSQTLATQENKRGCLQTDRFLMRGRRTQRILCRQFKRELGWMAAWCLLSQHDRLSLAPQHHVKVVHGRTRL